MATASFSGSGNLPLIREWLIIQSMGSDKLMAFSLNRLSDGTTGWVNLRVEIFSRTLKT